MARLFAAASEDANVFRSGIALCVSLPQITRPHMAANWRGWAVAPYRRMPASSIATGWHPCLPADLVAVRIATCQ
ncbi:hypothetical protein A9K71_10315 [Mesorhizobium sp. WSM3873]|nr:hypothetical protein A9K71_10315 [Mesorhizobium sp. WSM3873]